ncbi:MAG: HNH endonuclease, partial [Dermatophilaceae bacterium]|nr:HNH endonuclease [Dermatophilaceae bacterium]
MPFTSSPSPLELALGAALERAGVQLVEADPLPSLFTAGDEALREIEQLEAEKARLEGRLVDAYAALHTVIEQQHDVLELSRGPAPVDANTVVTREIACATGVGAAEVSRRLELATTPRRHRVLREALRSGSVSLYRALRVVAETRLLSDELLPAIEAAVLAPAPDGSVASARLFSTRLSRHVRSADDRAGDERRRSAEASRTAHGRLTDDGIGTFTVTAAAETVVAVLDRADAMARAARSAGDPRTLDQLRCDAICSLALFSSLADEHNSFGAPVPPATV